MKMTVAHKFYFPSSCMCGNMVQCFVWR